MLNKKSKTYLLKSCIVWGVLGLIGLLIFSYMLFANLNFSIPVIGPIFFSIWGMVFVGDSLFLLAPISFFCFTFSLRFFYLLRKLKRDRKLSSQRFSRGLMIVSSLFLIFSVVFFGYLYFSGYEGVRELNLISDVVRNPEKANTLFDKAVEDKDYERISTLVSVYEVSPDFLLRVYSYVQGDKEELISANSKYYPEENYYNLILSGIAFNGNTPTNVLYEIYSLGGEFASSVASNSNAPPELLREIFEKNPEAYFFLGSNGNTPQDILVNLSYDEDPYVRSSVAYNLNVSLEILERLADDEEANVRASVAGNPRASDEILEKLSRDSDEYVRESAETYMGYREEGVF